MRAWLVPFGVIIVAALYNVYLNADRDVSFIEKAIPPYVGVLLPGGLYPRRHLDKEVPPSTTSLRTLELVPPLSEYPETVQDGDVVTFHIYLRRANEMKTLEDNDILWTSDRGRERSSLHITVGKHEVIPAVEEALTRMPRKSNSRGLFLAPSDKCFGVRGFAPWGIRSNEDLQMSIVVLDVIQKPLGSFRCSVGSFFLLLLFLNRFCLGGQPQLCYHMRTLLSFQKGQTIMRLSLGLVLLVTLLLAVQAQRPQRNVTGGVVEGYIDNIHKIFVFKGIPYAAPPVESLRFAPPQDVVSWSGVRDASEFGAGCIAACTLPKPSVTCANQTSEDCLFLNVWSPSIASNASLPVLFFIHGGAFSAGTASCRLYESAELAASQQIVVVTINYRLGLLGALTSDLLKGNFMLQDQRKAMQWVQSNIAQFGGDPNRVTLAGQSAGAMSILCHMASKLSWPLFHAAIVSSGTFGVPLQSPELAKGLSDIVLTKLHCPPKGEAALACLRAAPVDLILNITENTRNFPWPSTILSLVMPWAPVMDGSAELPFEPMAPGAQGRLKPVPMMIGSLTDDSVLYTYRFTEKPITETMLDGMLTVMFGFGNAINIRLLYGPVPNETDTHIYASSILTDYMFTCASRYLSRGLVSNRTAPVYRFVFSHLPSFQPFMWHENMPFCDSYVCHATDLVFWFNPLYAVPDTPKPTAGEFELSRNMQNAWGNMVRTFTPNDPKSATVPWPAFDSLSDAIMNLDVPVPHPERRFRQAYCNYFDSIGYNRRGW